MPNSMESNGVTYYLAYNQVGSLRVVSDSSGNIVKEVNYDSFGNILSDSNSNFKVPFGFAGGLYDSDTNLTRFGYRDYDPYIGKWTARDPILFEGGSYNLYTYIDSDPINFIDPSGEFGIGGAIYGAISGATGGYISSGNLQGAIVGGVAGGCVGLVMPSSSNAVGAFASNSLASVVGQISANINNKNKNWYEINYGAVVGAGLGGLWGVKSPINNIAKSGEPFKTISNVVGGAKVGVGEFVGQEVTK